MDTKDQQFQGALLRLCHAVVDVMRLASDGDVPAELVQQTIHATLNNLVSITNNYSSTSSNNIAAGISSHQQNNEPEVSSVQTQANSSDTLVSVKYAGNPTKVNDTYRFVRLASEQDDQKYYKISIFEDNSVKFEILDLNGERLNEAWRAKAMSFPEGVILIENEDHDSNKTLISTHFGTGFRQGNAVMVKTPCNAKFN